MKPVYITAAAAFLPHAAVDNETIEARLGMINDLPSRTKRIVLKNNGILTRHYAIEPQTGELTHTSAQLAAEAVRRLKPYTGFSPDQIGCLCCATTCPDLLFPGHALMVAGELALPPLETVSTHGICMSGMAALKYAWLNVGAGLSQNAVATAAELASSFMRAAFFTSPNTRSADLERQPLRAFDADFLRWMLSDGAGALFLADQPQPANPWPNLRLDWLEQVSFAGEIETCMYAGGVKQEDGSVIGWRNQQQIPDEKKRYLYAVRQDIKLLERHIVPTMGRALRMVIQKHNLAADAMDWFLPHYSSAFFRDKFYQEMQRCGFEIPEDRWFTNLVHKGNTGSAAIYIILEELLHSGRLTSGQKLLCFVPESGRFSHSFMLLTVVC